jgi:dihydrofolate reductase
VIGGAELFAAALPLADELYLTELDLEVEGDAFFPEWDRGAFVETSRTPGTSAEGIRFAFVAYRRARDGGRAVDA